RGQLRRGALHLGGWSRVGGADGGPSRPPGALTARRWRSANTATPVGTPEIVRSTAQWGCSR
ncbi:MAG TPA: hypothetical protein VIL36_04415, partial [Acidimicrobiales bacterium]